MGIGSGILSLLQRSVKPSAQPSHHRGWGGCSVLGGFQPGGKPINHRKQRAWPRLLIHCGGHDNPRCGAGECKSTEPELIIEDCATLVDDSFRGSLVGVHHLVCSKE